MFLVAGCIILVLSILPFLYFYFIGNLNFLSDHERIMLSPSKSSLSIEKAESVINLPAKSRNMKVKTKVTINDKQEGKTEHPSALTLLTSPSPFNASDIIKLSDRMITSNNTIVTAYFRTTSKTHTSFYDDWMKNMLGLQDAMVIFTQADVIPQIKEFRSHALNRTAIVPMELEDLPIASLYSQEFWQGQMEKNPWKRKHRSYHLLWIWLSKTWFATQAIRMNLFQSDLFVWSDIGCFRGGSGAFHNKTMIRHPEKVPPNEMLQMAHRTPNPPKEEIWGNSKHDKDHFYHSGSQFAAYKDTWWIFHKYFLETIDKFLEKNMFIGEDQHILQSVCLQHPEICAYATPDQVNDNKYFGLRWVLHGNKKIEYWRHRKE